MCKGFTVEYISKYAVVLVSQVGIDKLLWRMLRTEGYVLVEHLAAGEGMQT